MTNEKIYLYIGIVVAVAIMIGIVFYVLPSGDAVNAPPSKLWF